MRLSPKKSLGDYYMDDVKTLVNNLTWYAKIDLINELIIGLIPGDYDRGKTDVLEIIYLTDNLLSLTPEQRIKTAIKLLKQIQETHFSKLTKSV